MDTGVAHTTAGSRRGHLRPRCNVELAVGTAELVLNDLGGDEEGLCNLPVTAGLGGKPARGDAGAVAPRRRQPPGLRSVVGADEGVDAVALRTKTWLSSKAEETAWKVGSAWLRTSRRAGWSGTRTRRRPPP